MTSVTEFPTGPEARRAREARLHRLDRMARAMDTRYGIPGTSIRFGWDSILGLVPGVGDLAAAIPSAIILYEGVRMGARRRVLAQIGTNMAIDLVIGGVPVLGDAFDLFFKSHRRNMALLRAEVEGNTA